MSKVILFSILLVLSVVAIASAFPGDTLWTQTYGGIGSDVIWGVQETTDGGFIMAGYTESGGKDIYLVKANSTGDTSWTKTYGGTDIDWATSVYQTADGGYIVGGYSGSSPAVSEDYILLKTDSNGDTLWTHYYGGTSGQEGWALQITSDGGYVMAGFTGSGGTSVYLVKTNGDGDILWTRTYGGSNADMGRDVQQTSDGGYILTGYTKSFGAGAYDVYLVKTDENGDTLWTRTYGGESNDQAYEVMQTSDNGYIIAASTKSFGSGGWDFYVIKTDNGGTVEWEKTFGGAADDEGFAVNITQNGDFIISGDSKSFSDGNRDIYVVALNPNGDTLWTRTYGGSTDDRSFAVNGTSDGSHLVGGYTSSFGAGSRDFWLLKLEGEVYTGFGLIYNWSDFTFDVISDSAASREYQIYSIDSSGYAKSLCDSSWVSFDNDSVYLNPGDTVTITASFDATGMDYFTTYGTEIYFESDAPGLDTRVIPVTMNIYPPIAIEIGMIPDNTPIIVQPGGYFTFTGTLESIWNVYVMRDVWTMVELPEGGLYGPVGKMLNIPMAPGGSYTYESLRQNVPFYALPGDYKYISFVGDFYDWLEDSCSFDFTITSGSPVSNNDEWIMSSWIDGYNNDPITDFHLLGNYPNPFNEETNISFYVAGKGWVNLSIYNLAGQKIETLVDGELKAGQHSVNWDASIYSSGIYFCKLNAEGKSYTKRMTLLK
ncbi:MAG: T9SS type A sorting domain-containing protein [candidate division Zixibacteria bacterium]|nr:T9SS type A sorting domain-containing protein [candidate division Zixibacteria bacterium]